MKAQESAGKREEKADRRADATAVAAPWFWGCERKP